MTKKRSIVVNNPQLRKIRNNLRLFLLSWARSEWNKAKDEELKITRNGEGKVRHPNSYTKEEKEILTVLSKRTTGNTEMVDKSICKCYRCVATNKNMTYNPIEMAWFCFQCYEEMRRLTAKKKTGISMRFP